MIFRFKEFEVRHRDSLLKVNTDAVLLGAITMHDASTNSILDIGTGCGVIALMLAQKFPKAIIHGLEPDEASCQEAAFNFENAPFASRMKTYHEPLQNFDPDRQYDLIVSNPPYFEVPEFEKGNNTQNISERRKKLATQFTLNFDELAQHASRLLETDGAFFVIIPANASEKFDAICTSNGLHKFHTTRIQSKSSSAFQRVVLGFGKTIRRDIETSLIIYNEDGTRHLEYISITKDFYL